MVWRPASIARVLALLTLLACGGGNKKPANPKPDSDAEAQSAPPPADSEEDREKKRHTEATALIPEGSSCLPASLRNPTAPRLELAAIGTEAVVCAVDQDRTRLLGPIACWAIAVGGPKPGAMTYQTPAPLPGRSMSVMFDDRCARGFCLPKDAKVPTDPIALMAWNLEGSKVAVLAGDTVHLFDAATKAHTSSFAIRGDKGVTSEPTGIHWNGDAIFIEASDGTNSPVFVFRPDGSVVGPIEALGAGKEKTLLSTRNGSFLLLDRSRVAISEQGLSTLTVYETETGKRSKLVRKIPPGPCKKEELDAMWHDPTTNLAPKCKEFVSKNYAHLIGADAVAGTKNLLVLLRGPRLGELAVIDAKTLAEHKSIKMPWCDDAGGGAATPAGAAAASQPASDGKKPRGAAKTGAKTSDSDDDGQ